MVGQAGLEPAVRNAPDLQSGGVTNFPTDPYLSISITRGPSPYVHNLRVYSISEETQSELRGATPNFWPQRCHRPKAGFAKSHAGMITYNFHPPFRIVPNSLISINPIKN